MPGNMRPKLPACSASHYPAAKCTLDFRTPLELLVATILSAQCTDERVNIVTKDLFRKYRSAADFAQGAPSPSWKKLSKARVSFATKRRAFRTAAGCWSSTTTASRRGLSIN